MKYLTPIVLTVLYVAAVALCGEVGQRSRVAEVCIEQSAVVDANGMLASVTIPNHPDSKIKSGYYSSVYARDGWAIGGIVADQTNPNLVCLLKITVNNGVTSIECARPAGRGCSTSCTLEQDGGSGGLTKYSCACSNRP